MKKEIENYNFTNEEWETCIKVLRELAIDPHSSPNNDITKGLITKIYKKARKDNKKILDANIRQFDSELLETTIIKNLAENKLPDKFLGIENDKSENNLTNQDNKIKLIDQTLNISSILKRPISCYICKKKYNKVHFFYHLLCPECANFNFLKRSQKTDLSSRVALVTGGRVKIGYQVALKLLRDKARVIVTTRFPYDAAYRFSQEKDFSEWKNNLQIYGLELRNLPLVESFISHLLKTEDTLDIIINNAAQTIKRPSQFYNHLVEKEKQLSIDLVSSGPIVNNFYNYSSNKYLSEAGQKEQNKSLSNEFFPENQYDAFLQQIDLRPENSWVLTLDKVDTLELLETHLVNAFAPFIINSKLKPLMLKSKFEKKFIINVSAMEGQFNRINKTQFHPHTNMAKAAMNMMTRTAAMQYVKDNIFMNSVDTGWITQENPYAKMYHIRKKGFVPPLDIIDGASRIYDPIVSGINSNTTEYGKFLKDYHEYPW